MNLWDNVSPTKITNITDKVISNIPHVAILNDAILDNNIRIFHQRLLKTAKIGIIIRKSSFWWT